MLGRELLPEKSEEQGVFKASEQLGLVNYHGLGLSAEPLLFCFPSQGWVSVVVCGSSVMLPHCPSLCAGGGGEHSLLCAGLQATGGSQHPAVTEGVSAGYWAGSICVLCVRLADIGCQGGRV